MTGPQRTFRFALVGGLGFCVDAGVLMAIIGLLGPDGGRLVSFCVAVGVTFLCNRTVTFADRRGRHATHIEFSRYFLAMIAGGALNLGIYGVVVRVLPISGLWPVVAVAAGSLAGMGLNLTLAHRFVFQPPAS